MEDADDISILETRHKKERKELQAKIQSLKKSMKNDKTKKKELAIEIAQLESDLENQHKKEMEDVKLSKKTDDSLISNNSEGKPQKISKAQKRRDKKSLLEKSRDEEIKLQAKDNLLGPRTIEAQEIITRLKVKGLQLCSIPSDGDCLYKAVSHQLLLLRKVTASVDELRKNVAAFIQENKEDFLPFMSNPNTCEMFTELEFVDYCEKIVQTKVWGGQLEIRALSNYLKCPITIIQASGPDAIEQGVEFDGPPLVISYHRHMYSLGEHYNSTQPIE